MTMVRLVTMVILVLFFRPMKVNCGRGVARTTGFVAGRTVSAMGSGLGS